VSQQDSAPVALHAQKQKNKPRYKGKATGAAEGKGKPGQENAPPQHNKQSKGQKAKGQDAASDKPNGQVRFALVAALSATSSLPIHGFKWVFDTGATHHMSYCRDDFIDYSEVNIKVQFGCSSTTAVGIGSVLFWSLQPNGSYIQSKLEDVLHVPELAVRLFSVTHAMETLDNVRAVMVDGACTFYVIDNDGVEHTLFNTCKENSLMFLDVHPTLAECKSAKHAKRALLAANVAAVSDPISSSALHANFSVAPENDDISPPPESNAPCTTVPDDATVTSSSNVAAFPANVPQNVHDKALLWHARLGHINFDYIVRMVDDGIVTGVDVTSHALRNAKNAVCEPCMLGKACRLPFGSSTHHSDAPLQLLHMDLCGPLQVPSMGGALYVATIVDDASRFAIVRAIPNKSDASSIVQEVIAFLENQTGMSLKAVRTDRGGEYLNHGLESYFRGKGVLHQTTCPHTPQQNGVAERFNRTLFNSVRAMLIQSGVPGPYWAEAVQTACTLHNVTPSSATGSYTPWELLFHNKPDLSGLRVFGCAAYVTIPKVQRKKLDPPGSKGIFLGYSIQAKGYRVLLLDSNQMVLSRDVKFVESEFPLLSGEVLDPTPTPVFPPELLLMETVVTAAAPVAPSPAVPPQLDMFESDDEVADFVDVAEAFSVPNSPACPIAPTAADAPLQSRFGRELRQPDRFAPAAHIAASLPPDPNTYKQAMSASDSARWQEAIDEELNSMQENNVWELVPKPPGVKLIRCRWVFKKKFNADGTLDRYKARLVAKGFTQEFGVDYEEVFAPVSKHSTFRALLALVASEDLELYHWDVRTAFLQGDLEEEIYMEQPPGCFADADSHPNPNLVCRLRRSLYGLKQAPRAWHQKLKSELLTLGFMPSDADPSLYVLHSAQGTVYLLTYVDDLLPATNSLPLLKSVWTRLRAVFDIRDLGPATYFLGMEINRDRGARVLKLSQHKMIRELLGEHGKVGGRAKIIPMSTSVRLAVTPDGQELDSSEYPYRTVVGKLLYIANCTRPDISYVVGVLCRYMSKPSIEHWNVAMGVLSYLSSTPEFALVYSNVALCKTVGYCDSDHGGSEGRRSCTGYVFVAGGAAIAWSSRLQQTVAASTTEAEYMAAAAAVKEAIWLRQLFATLGVHICTLQMYCDNQAAISLVKNPQSSQRSKHIDIIYHFARQRVQRKEVAFAYCMSEANVADVFTKALPGDAFDRCVAGLGLS
jgi:hypothetical protein